jgi:uncharacterized membrane protein YgaE (UPF0421/DUF939 family)
MLNTKKARDALGDILHSREYRAYYTDSQNIFVVWWEKAKEWLANLLAKLFPSIDSTSGAAGPILIVVIVAVIGLLGWLVFLLIRNTRQNLKMNLKKPLQSMSEISWSFQTHLAEADKQEEMGDYTLATRHLFLALLLFFHDKEWLEARIWKTNWEYYEELRKVNHQGAELFYKLSAFFDEITYGERKASKEETAQFRSVVMNWLNKTNAKVEM